MTKTNILNNKISSSGVKKQYIADKLGLTTACLYNKISNITEFKASEIVKMTQILNLSNSERDDIFLS